MALPILEKYASDIKNHRVSQNSWPKRCIFSDLVRPFKVTDKQTKQTQIILMTMVPPTPNFWSAWLALYVVYGCFPNHYRACRRLLKEIRKAKFHIKGLTDLEYVWDWLVRSSEGKQDNLFFLNPILCCANMHNEMLIAENKVKHQDDLGKPDPELIHEMQKKYLAILKKSKEQKKNDDRQGQGADHHCMEGERGLGAGNGDGDGGGAVV